MQISSQNILANLKSANNATKGDAVSSKYDAKQKEALSNMQSALETMKQSKTNVSEMKKSMAVARFQQLSEQIEMLKKNFSGDPKVLAKQIARLMKELKSIAKQYGDAIGSAANNIGGGYSVGQNSQQTNASSPDNQSNNNDINNQDLSQQEFNSESSDTEIGKEIDETKNGKPADNDPKSTKEEKDKEQQKEINYWGQFTKNNEDDEFLKKLRKALDDLKSLFEINKAAVKFTYPDDKDAEKDLKEFEKDYKSTLKELESIESSTRLSVNTGNLVSITI